MDKVVPRVVPNITNSTGPALVAANELLAPQVIIISLILITNIFMFYVFFNNKNTLIQTPSNRLIISLSVSHFLAGLVLLGEVIKALLFQSQIRTIKSAKYRILIEILMTFCVKATLLHLCGITLDRYISLFYPLRYNAIVTKKKLNSCITFTWVTAFFVSAIQLLWLYDYVFLERMPRNGKLVMEIEKWYSVTVFVIVSTLTLLLGVLFTLMFMEIRKILFRHQEISGKRHFTRYNCMKQRGALYIFVLMYLLFTSTTMPYFTVRFVFDLKLCKIPKAMYTIMGLFKETVNFLNPILYITRNHDFWLAAKNVLSCESGNGIRNGNQSHEISRMKRKSVT